MKEIKLTQNKTTVVDDEYFDFVSQWPWCYHRPAKKRDAGYAVRTDKSDGKQRTVRLHRVIAELAGIPADGPIDHHDGDRLNNCRSNLRPATHQQNSCNRPKSKNNKSGYKGVRLDKRRKKWPAAIMVNGKSHHLGTFASGEIAARAYDAAALKLHGKFARLNFAISA